MKNDVEGNADRGVTPPIDSMTPRSAFFFVLSTPRSVSSAMSKTIKDKTHHARKVALCHPLSPRSPPLPRVPTHRSF